MWTEGTPTSSGWYWVYGELCYGNPGQLEAVLIENGKIVADIPFETDEELERIERENDYVVALGHTGSGYTGHLNWRRQRLKWQVIDPPELPERK